MRLQNHDPLTGLPNRVLAEEIFQQRLRLGEREGFSVSLMFIDLDGFKSVNDSLGHVAGDHFLKTIAQRFSKTIRDTDIVCRFAGDEFVVIAVHENEQANHGYSALAEKLLFALSKPVKLGESYISLTASIGIAVAPAQGKSFEELNQKADIAMYSIKESGRNSYRYYHQDMSKDNVRQLTLAQGLRKACHSGQLSLHFQSKQRLKDNKVFGAEALLRWVHPELGVVSPVEFIPIAESCGAIIEIGEWVLVEAVKACAQWHKLGFTNMSVAVNVSALQLVRGDFHSKIQVTLKKYKLPAKFLVLELTESLLFDLDGEHKKSIESLRALGIRLAIDDFGTGYSNLRYLQEHDIQMLKIDRSFVSKMLSSKQDLAIVETIANMSKTLGMDIVAEGIEDNETKAALMNLGCLLGQGYLWNKPLHHDAFIAYLQAQMTSGA
jgi:diguanylate cyclase (GGDEF)-like protein